MKGNCMQKEPKLWEVIASWIMGATIGIFLALVYIYRTGGF
jgi:hypothetical protein